jgi:hypothetical protein
MQKSFLGDSDLSTMIVGATDTRRVISQEEL